MSHRYPICSLSATGDIGEAALQLLQLLDTILDVHQEVHSVIIYNWLPRGYASPLYPLELHAQVRKQLLHEMTIGLMQDLREADLVSHKSDTSLDTSSLRRRVLRRAKSLHALASECQTLLTDFARCLSELFPHSPYLPIPTPAAGSNNEVTPYVQRKQDLCVALGGISASMNRCTQEVQELCSRLKNRLTELDHRAAM